MSEYDSLRLLLLAFGLTTSPQLLPATVSCVVCVHALSTVALFIVSGGCVNCL